MKFMSREKRKLSMNAYMNSNTKQVNNNSLRVKFKTHSNPFQGPSRLQHCQLSWARTQRLQHRQRQIKWHHPRSFIYNFNLWRSSVDLFVQFILRMCRDECTITTASIKWSTKKWIIICLWKHLLFPIWWCSYCTRQIIIVPIYMQSKVHVRDCSAVFEFEKL